jgi:pimeloyl-ACP methyl ester carboxylesterase
MNELNPDGSFTHKVKVTDLPILRTKEIQVHGLYKKSLSKKAVGTILLLPGLDDSVFEYKKTIRLIMEKNQEWDLLALDLRGQGKTFESEKNVSTQKIPLDQQASLIKKTLTSFDIEKVFIIALSYGAGVCFKFTDLFPENVEGMGLIAPYVSKFKNHLPGLSGLYYSLLQLNPFYKKISEVGLPMYFLNARIKGRLNNTFNWTPARMQALTKLTLGIIDLDTDQVVEKFKFMPKGVHLLTACEDKVIPISAHRHLYNTIPRNVTKSFGLEEGIGHRVLVEHPKEAANWVHRILS